VHETQEDLQHELCPRPIPDVGYGKSIEETSVDEIHVVEGRAEILSFQVLIQGAIPYFEGLLIKLGPIDSEKH
jgi:hypothetical protein